MRFGIHMPQKGGFARNVKRAVEIGCISLQLFVGNPASWTPPRFDDEELEKRRLLLEEHGVYPLVVHASYLINLAAVKNEFYQKSRQLLWETARRAYLLGSPYVVLHVGSHGGRGFKEGLSFFVDTLQKELENWPKGVELLLENTAGGGTSLGGSFIALGSILNELEGAPVGVCFDSAHAWAAGYDLSSKEGVDKTVDELLEHVGIGNIKAIHANDSSTLRGSHRDRHAHLGEGYIGEEGLEAFLSYPWIDEIPIILETPEMGTKWDELNLKRLRSYADNSGHNN